MRYFLVSYYYQNGFGSIYISTEDMPSRTLLKSEVGSDIIIINYFEFNTLEDYNNSQS